MSIKPTNASNNLPMNLTPIHTTEKTIRNPGLNAAFNEEIEAPSYTYFKNQFVSTG